MTIKEKTEALDKFCEKQRGCRFCPLGNDLEECTVGDGDFENVSAEEIEKAYNLAYGEKKEEINHPDRYIRGGFECIDVMLAVFGEEAVQNFCVLNAFKYIWRHKQKGGVEDIKKAIWYLNKFVELEELPDD